MYSNFGNFGENVFTKIRKKINEPIVIKSKLFKKNFNFWPFILLGDRANGIDEQSLIIHENTHLRQRKGLKLVPEMTAYALSPNHRWKAEKEAYTNEIRNVQSRGLIPNYDQLIDHINTDYRYHIGQRMASLDEIKSFVYWLRDSNPYK